MIQTFATTPEIYGQVKQKKILHTIWWLCSQNMDAMSMLFRLW